MSRLKLALIWISAGMLVVSLGWFASASADRPAAPADHTAADAPRCVADASELSGTLPADLAPDLVPAARCPVTFVWTCCACGGCGCRPQNQSPANWCGCDALTGDPR